MALPMGPGPPGFDPIFRSGPAPASAGAGPDDVSGGAIGVVDMLAGSAAQWAGAAKVLSADQWGPDLLELIYGQPMALTTALTTTDSYAVAAETANGEAVAVTSVFLPYSAAGFSDRVFLVVSQPTDGARYRVTASGAMMTVGGGALHPSHNYGKFVARPTKIDQMLLRHPFWKKTIGSTTRGLFSALARQMDGLHGARDDDLTP